MNESESPLLTTPLDALHRRLGGKMVPFAGYAMPVQYSAGIMTEHLHTRAKASLFDVSHMGQVEIRGEGCARWLETLVPGEIQGLGVGKTRYTVFTNDQGGILDDLMVSKLAEDHLFVVINAACKAADFAHMQARLGGKVDLRLIGDRALVALQGPKAAEAMARVAPGALDMTFMTIREIDIAGIACLATRSGYTGEDGWEISVPAGRAEDLVQTLLALPDVMPAGLGARDSLRLEAGLCLYGSDIDAATTPVEANLSWIMNKRRRAEGGFPGADVIQKQLAEGPARLRIGIQPLGRAPARAHTEITDAAGNRLGEICSGGFGPSADRPIAMGYVPRAFAAIGTRLTLMVRGKPLDAEVAALPFVPHRYVKG
ncbi:glycine cleavage system aminomethyltransferase GcvT [Magnetospirillum sp. SS-4]|uniref:glycine cleavage system aminomethyltransferase GcvT n=1 Tax=Magnetospirillum sp. SS-4 TaxID=2681465 RepID=UPI00137EF992|nr:glycine cleavage system aminomethyltransferase GcvT [Magnetospirillum sp. SS-4]CAA7620996.1 Aminomethyltransferase [Magnetospirillum sp. SS-4]